MTPQRLEDLETPAALVDLERARANAVRVVAYGREHGIGWRPHVKTHKSRSLARIQLEAGAIGLTVATPREAEVMCTLTDDLLLAYPVVGDRKLERLMALPGSVDLIVGLDSAEVMQAFDRAAVRAGRRVRILVETDVGMSRVGLSGTDDVVALASRVRDAAGLEYAGLMFYPGHIRVQPAAQDVGIAGVSEQLEALYAALGAEGLSPEIVSGGSTPTLWRSHEMTGVTEIRSGTAIYFDREGIALGAATADDVAYTVLATVVSTAVPGQAVVDAGSKALSREGRGGDGFGEVFGRPEVPIKGLSEEHGVLDLTATDWRPRVGDRVRLVPNHVCVSVNLQDRLYALGEDSVSAVALEGRGRDPFVDTA